MKIAVLSSFHPPSERFGTEFVAHELATIWSSIGHDVVLVGHQAGGTAQGTWAEDGVCVTVLPPLPSVNRMEQYSRTPRCVPGFSAFVETEKPEVAIIVGFSPSTISVPHVSLLYERGCPVTLWHHVPGITCQQHGLRLKNRTPCDGQVVADRCASCRLVAAGVPELVADTVVRLPRFPRAWAMQSAAGHLLGAKELSTAFLESVRQLSAMISMTFVGANWVRDVLLRNSFSRERLHVVRPGLRSGLAKALASCRSARSASAPLTFGYWGRIDDTKGIETAIRAVRAVEGEIVLNIAGDFLPGRPFDDRLMRMRGEDSRIRFLGRLDEIQLSAMLASLDVAIIPSIWPETGPLTVFEAHAAGLPILGARTGGIAEICGGDASAQLFEREDVASLSAMIEFLIKNPDEVARRRRLVPEPRSMRSAASEIMQQFERIVGPGRLRMSSLST